MHLETPWLILLQFLAQNAIIINLLAISSYSHVTKGLSENDLVIWLGLQITQNENYLYLEKKKCTCIIVFCLRKTNQLFRPNDYIYTLEVKFKFHIQVFLLRRKIKAIHRVLVVRSVWKEITFDNFYVSNVHCIFSKIKNPIEAQKLFLDFKTTGTDIYKTNCKWLYFSAPLGVIYIIIIVFFLFHFTRSYH